LPEPIDGEESPGVANHRSIPGARTYRKHTGSPIDWPAKAIKADVQHQRWRGHDPLPRWHTPVPYRARVGSRAELPGCLRVPRAAQPGDGVIGNAVAVAVAEAIGMSLIEHCQSNTATVSSLTAPART
jgi:DNA (cytosine-5)-methyltransferase 1